MLPPSDDTAQPDQEDSGDSDGLHIFERANMEFEETDDNSSPDLLLSQTKDINNKDASHVEETPSMSQASESEGLREAMKYMMKEFRIDLFFNSGEIGSTRHFLCAGARPDGYPIWEPNDDVDLKKSNPKLLSHLITKYEISKIPIHLLEGNAFVWNAEDARKIREEHGLVGKLVGALARKPMQNTRLGLPLELLPEEARLLAENGAATLLYRCLRDEEHGSPSDSPMDDTSPSSAVHKEESSKAEAFQNFLKNSYKEQRRLAVEDKRRTLESLSKNIMECKNKRKRKHEQEEQVESSSSHGPINELQNLEESFNFPEEAMMVQIPTARTSLPIIEAVDLSKPLSDWPYAGQKKHELRFKVFKDLWQKGYYLTNGGKFGGDFLVYPGDPMRFHAHYIAICIPQDEELALSDIITAGRLGTNVKKTVLLCSSNEEGLVTYTSLQWSGMQ